MNSLTCPACGTAMQTRDEPDLQVDVCPQCGGRFLDKGELNIVATGMAGDIEFCSIDEDAHQDRFPARVCPRCPDQKMRKINLLAFSDIIFDFCSSCGGFFLDRGETKGMNEVLAKLSGTPIGEEYRGMLDDHLVRLNRIRDVNAWASFGAFGSLKSRPVESCQVLVYFKTPLNLSLRIFKEAWQAKLAKLLGVFRGQDIRTGDKPFDDAFIVQAEDDDKAKRLLSETLRQALLEFVRKGHCILSQPGSLTVWDDRIEYREGPYAVPWTTDLEKDATALARELVKLAALFESD